MIKRKKKFTDSIDFSEFELGEKIALMQKRSHSRDDLAQQAAAKAQAEGEVATAYESDGLKGDAKILYNAYVEFSKAGMTTDKKEELKKIDDVLQDASIQLTRDGEAVITDADGKSTKVRPR